MKIYLINPKPDNPCIFGEEIVGGNLLFIADNSLPTVAACLPPNMDIELCEERVTPINYETEADWVGITGRIAQQRNMIAIAKKFRELGKKVLIGGAFAARFSDRIKPYCDIIIKGEFEEIAKTVFEDIEKNDYKSEYQGTRPNPLVSPIPRWDLYPTNKALVGTIQITRGCPFKCDFCDVIEFNGRESRFKKIENVIKELNVLYYDHHFQTILITDDNVLSNIPYAEQMLKAVALWRENKNVSFIIQAPVLLTKSDKLLKLFAEAGVKQTYIGVESFSSELLQSVHKSHNNINMTPNQSVDKLLEYGMLPMVGFIMGFDEHTPEIFDITYKGTMTLAAPILYIQGLVAYPHTPLYDKLEKENRLHCSIEELTGYPWHTNMIPKHMTTNELGRSVHALLRRVYSPDAFMIRLKHMLTKIKPIDMIVADSKMEETFSVFAKIVKFSKADRNMCQYLLKHHRNMMGYIFRILATYAQLRLICDKEYTDI